MTNLGFYSLMLLITTTTITTATNSTALNYITTSCKTTLYPTLCVHSLSIYVNSIQLTDRHLAKTAISVSLNNANSATSFVTKLAGSTRLNPRELQAVQDCVNNMNNCVTSLSQSVQELNQLALFRGQGFEWHMNNVETWVSSALTNENTCARGFSDGSMDGHVKDVVSRRMVYVAQLTSNALALVNRFALRHKAGTHMP